MKLFFTAIALFSFIALKAQDCSIENSMKYQQQLNKEYVDPLESPLTPKDLKKFKSLDFYPVDMAYCVEAKFVRTPDEKPFAMPTTTDRKPMYVKYGELYFTLQGKQCKLDIFQNIDLSKKEEFKNYLFLPFTDFTSGNGSYGGGRYIDLQKPDTDKIMIDFNTAYNPYCAYNHKYSCPIPPAQNDLQVEVKAGVKAYDH
ncbi:DUF1684 domain-containing protein [Flavobacterium suzhouense]|uniref:DUF1684 domain-containing protein n=1 Tax=Flavobacterium suzhouense TaxID=1529638 RepID=A0ABW5NYE4_9FLAO